MATQPDEPQPEKKKSEADVIREALWHTDSASAVDEKSHLIEQYKLYVEMADRISQRRGTANTFFLTFNTALVGALAGFFREGGNMTSVTIALYFAAIILSLTWILLLRSYRNLNAAKFKVIGEMEKRLPAQAYYAAEWKALGEGKDIKKYIPLSVIETAVPIAYMGVYLYLCVQMWP